MKAISLHRDVLVVTSQLLQLNCTIVRGPVTPPQATDAPLTVIEPKAAANGEQEEDGQQQGAAEVFVIDCPVLPEELELLPSLLEQAGFQAPQGLLVTHADWDHLLAPLAFPDAALGCAESSALRLRAEPGAAQRELRSFDERLLLTRRRPLALGSVQPLVVPGRCGIGDAELELHPTDGHTADGMAVVVPWARVLIAGDYLSSVELPALDGGDRIDAYLATLELLRALVAAAEHIVPGHGPVLQSAEALEVLEQDVAYLNSLRRQGAGAELPAGRRSKGQRDLHAENVRKLAA
jgi:glyoxylase-like metal-dependent hydrolase (beta-lactamase superfamily II)